ncbi:MAG: ATP-dependent DNA helicase [Burkholderiaceae bacterium]
MSRTPYTVAVRVLCAFAAKTGDLDLRFTPAPTVQQGIAGHRTVAASRSASYRSEVAVSGRFEHLVVRGRADGFDKSARLIEEVKTFRGSLDRIPANHRALHRAQARVYAWLLCEEHALPSMTVSLVYFDVGRQREEMPVSEECSAAELRVFFESLCRSFVDWADRETEHRAARDEAFASMAFPYPSFRTGQRELAEAVFRGARSGRCVVAQAPTGIGKTVGTLFPLLKGCAFERIDKVFFLTAKGTGRHQAVEAIATIRGTTSLPMRVLELTARDKACENPGSSCDGDSCPLARGFYDRLPAARSVAVDAGTLDRAALRTLALAHDVCPYWFGQAMIHWTDVVIGDYNHFFDGNAALHGLTEANAWRVSVLVDEAHNLVDRARAMYSAELRSDVLQALRVTASGPVKKPLEKLHRAWQRLVDGQEEAYFVHDACPRQLAAAMLDVTVTVAELMSDEAAAIDATLLGFHFDLLHFTRLLDTFDAHSLFDVSLAAVGTRARDAASTLCVRNVVPAPFLKPRFAATHSTTLFSATLTPTVFYTDTLGLPDDAVAIEVAAPFRPEQLAVHVVDAISTRYRDRERSLLPIARVIGRQYIARRGNYLAFFSSFQYLERAADAFALLHPEIPAWRQARRMTDAERDAFLARFAVGGRGIGFAVLGGAFAEGVDLVGDRLIGAFIATLGLPQVNHVNEQLMKRMDVLFGAGYDYTYLYPGIRKVTQAAGRVIRTMSDSGSVHLIDDRYARHDVAKLLPGWWRIVDRPT